LRNPVPGSESGRRMTCSMPVRRNSRVASPPPLAANQQPLMRNSNFIADEHRLSCFDHGQVLSNEKSQLPADFYWENTDPNMQQEESTCALHKCHPAPLGHPSSVQMAAAFSRSFTTAPGRLSIAAPAPQSALRFLVSLVLLAVALYMARNVIEGQFLAFTLRMLDASPSCEVVWAAYIVGFLFCSYRFAVMLASLTQRHCGCCRKRTMRQ